MENRSRGLLVAALCGVQGGRIARVAGAAALVPLLWWIAVCAVGGLGPEPVESQPWSMDAAFAVGVLMVTSVALWVPAALCLAALRHPPDALCLSLCFGYLSPILGCRAIGGTYGVFALAMHPGWLYPVGVAMGGLTYLVLFPPRALERPHAA